MLLEEPQQLEAYILKTKDKYVYSQCVKHVISQFNCIKGQTIFFVFEGLWWGLFGNFGGHENYFSHLGSAFFFR